MSDLAAPCQSHSLTHSLIHCDSTVKIEFETESSCARNLHLSPSLYLPLVKQIAHKIWTNFSRNKLASCWPVT